MDPLEIMKKNYAQRDLAARAFKDKGGKVVGYISDCVPEEIILAAGFFPLRISGNPFSGTEAADKYTEPVYEGFVRSMLNMLLTGEYDFLDYLIIPHDRDAIHALYGILNDVSRLDPSLKLPELYFFDILHTRSWLSGQFLRDRVYELKTKLEEWSARRITNESLSKAIAVVNENRQLLKKIELLRIADPPRISGVEALQIIGTSMFILKEDHNTLLIEYLENAEHLPARDGVRLFLEGSPVDNLQFYEIVESCGATIVSEDNCWGNRYFQTQVDQSLEPLEAINIRYHLKPPSPRTHPLEKTVAYCLESAITANVQGTVFYVLEWDYAQTWALPDEISALKENGIPPLAFKHLKYLLSEDDKTQIRKQLQKFIESIRNNSGSV